MKDKDKLLTILMVTAFILSISFTFAKTMIANDFEILEKYEEEYE